MAVSRGYFWSTLRNPRSNMALILSGFISLVPALRNWAINKGAQGIMEQEYLIYTYYKMCLFSLILVKVFRSQRKTVYLFCCLFLLRSSTSIGRPYCYSSVSLSLLLYGLLLSFFFSGQMLVKHSE